FDVAVPRTLRALRRDEDPLAAERVVAAVWIHAYTFTLARVKLGVEYALVDGRLVRGDVEIDAGRIAAVGVAGRGSGIAAPGFVDLHIHGFAGVDFATADAAGYRSATEALLATGVTSFQPSFITASEDELVAALREVPDG